MWRPRASSQRSTWQEAVGLSVSANLQAHARRPGNGGPPGRGGGGPAARAPVGGNRGSRPRPAKDTNHPRAHGAWPPTGRSPSRPQPQRWTSPSARTWRSIASAACNAGSRRCLPIPSCHGCAPCAADKARRTQTLRFLDPLTGDSLAFMVGHPILVAVDCSALIPRPRRRQRRRGGYDRRNRRTCRRVRRARQDDGRFTRCSDAARSCSPSSSATRRRGDIRKLEPGAESFWCMFVLLLVVNIFFSIPLGLCLAAGTEVIAVAAGFDRFRVTESAGFWPLSPTRACGGRCGVFAA